MTAPERSDKAGRYALTREEVIQCKSEGPGTMTPSNWNALCDMALAATVPESQTINAAPQGGSAVETPALPGAPAVAAPTPMTDAIYSGGTIGQKLLREHAEQLERALADAQEHVKYAVDTCSAEVACRQKAEAALATARSTTRTLPDCTYPNCECRPTEIAKGQCPKQAPVSATQERK